jgi:hypothetical protein
VSNSGTWRTQSPSGKRRSRYALKRSPSGNWWPLHEFAESSLATCCAFLGSNHIGKRCNIPVAFPSSWAGADLFAPDDTTRSLQQAKTSSDGRSIAAAAHTNTVCPLRYSRADTQPTHRHYRKTERLSRLASSGVLESERFQYGSNMELTEYSGDCRYGARPDSYRDMPSEDARRFRMCVGQCTLCETGGRHRRTAALPQSLSTR